MKTKILCLVIWTLVAFSSCFAPEEQLTVGDLTLVDSFYRMERETLQVQLLDTCALYRKAILPSLIDSIRAERYTEIQKLIDENK